MARISIISAHRSAMTISPVSLYKHDSGSEMQLEIPSYRSSDSDPSPLHSVIFVCSNSSSTTAKLVEESFRLDAQLRGKDPSRLHYRWPAIAPRAKQAPRSPGPSRKSSTSGEDR